MNNFSKFNQFPNSNKLIENVQLPFKYAIIKLLYSDKKNVDTINQ